MTAMTAVSTHLDVDAVKVETGLGEVLELLAEELVVVGVGLLNHGERVGEGGR